MGLNKKILVVLKDGKHSLFTEEWLSLIKIGHYTGESVISHYFIIKPK